MVSQVLYHLLQLLQLYAKGLKSILLEFLLFHFIVHLLLLDPLVFVIVYFKAWNDN